MSHLHSVPSLELLLLAGRAVALVLGLLIFAWAFRHWRRAAMRDTQRVFEQLDLVRSELLIMKEVMHHTSQRSDSHRSDLHRNDSPSRNALFDTRIAQGASSGPVRGYEIAARMARNGAGKDELIRSCGITTHEAELLVKLHGRRQDASTSHSSANPAELIGRQPRMDGRQDGSMPRQSAAAASETQRTGARTATAASTTKAPMTQRSRLVAVG